MPMILSQAETLLVVKQEKEGGLFIISRRSKADIRRAEHDRAVRCIITHLYFVGTEVSITEETLKSTQKMRNDCMK